LAAEFRPDSPPGPLAAIWNLLLRGGEGREGETRKGREGRKGEP